jgi:hypothetical protein
MKPEHLQILQHTLGLDQYGQGKSYRNYFVTYEGDTAIDELVRAGFMADRGSSAMCGGMHVYYVTDAGIGAVRNESPSPPKLTRSQRRYLAFLNADSGLSFGEWLTGRRRRRWDEARTP